MTKPFHFYVVFNPMINKDLHYKTQAHEFYHSLKSKVASEDSEEAFMYWGKLKVDSSKSENITSFSNIIGTNKKAGEETHLYITDYHHFWVAKVESVHEEIFNESHALPFYDDKDVEMWFKITDMELLSAEFEETSYYLKQLYVDNDFHDEVIESINPYLGGLKFPLILQDNLNENYFRNVYSEDISRCIKNNPLINSPNASGGVASNMKSFVLPPQVFSMLSSLTKKELLDVEVSFSKREVSDSVLFEGVLTSYLRILESVMNDTLGFILKREFGNCLFISRCGTSFSDQKSSENISVDLFQGMISLDAFVSLLTDASKFGNISLSELEVKYPNIVEYFSQELIPFIEQEELVQMRSRVQQGERLVVNRVQVLKIRNNILGVGCIGVINSLFNLIITYESEYLYKNAG
jgi:hypothetical protein